MDGACGVLGWRVDGGVQVYDAPDHAGHWVSEWVSCPSCGHEWVAVAAAGRFGIECPACYEVDLWHRWGAQLESPKTGEPQNGE